MSKRRDQRNNVLAGTFVVIGVILFTAAIIALSDLAERLTPTNEYTVWFDLERGAAGLSPGSTVTLGGQPIGWVTDITLENNDEGQMAVRVRFKARRDVQMYENASPQIVTPLIGNIGTLNLPSAGDPATIAAFHGAGPQLEDGESLVGGLAPPSFLAQAGVGEPEIRSVRSIIANVERASERIDRILAQVDDNLPEVIDDVRSTTTDARATAARAREIADDARETWDGWRDRLTDILERGQHIAQDITDGVEDFRTRATGFLTAAREAIDDNRPRIDEFMENARQFSQRVNEELYQDIAQAVANGRESVEEFRRVGQRLNESLDDSIPNIERLLANSRLASDQLKLTLADVRAAPWRVLYQPGRKELESELIYGSVRSYVEAVSDLRAASASIEAALQRATTDAARPADPDHLADLARRLDAAFQRYEQREQEFFNTWIDNVRK